MPSLGYTQRCASSGIKNKMTKKIIYSVIKGIFPLLIYYSISKLMAPIGGFLYFYSFKEILGMSAFYSRGLIFFDTIIQIILHYVVNKSAEFNNVPLFALGFILNFPLCVLWIWGFSQMKNPNLLVCIISFLISSIISGFIYLMLNTINLKNYIPK